MNQQQVTSINERVNRILREFDALKLRYNSRTIDNDEYMIIKNKLLLDLFEFLSNHKKYLAIYKNIRNQAKLKAEEILQNPRAEEQTKAAARVLIETIDSLVTRPDYVAGGGRRTKKTRRFRKTKKTRRSRK